MQQVKSTMGGVMPDTAIPGASASGSPCHRGHTWGSLLLLCAQTAGAPAQHLALKHHLNQPRERKEWCTRLPRILLQGCKHLAEEEMLLVLTPSRGRVRQASLPSEQPHVGAATLCQGQATLLTPGSALHTSLHSLLSLALNHRRRAGGTWRSL